MILRTPFNGIIGVTELVIDCVKRNELDEAVEMLELIDEASKEGYALLDNLLQWSRLQAGQISFQPSLVPLHKVEREIKTLMAGNLKLKQVYYHAEISETLEVYADRNMLYTVFRNLISNAIKFTKEGGSISVSAREDEGHVIVVVEDNGVGMSREDTGAVVSVSARL